MRLTSAHSSPRDYVAPSSPPWWCPTIAPLDAFLPSARYSRLIWPAHARLENAREGSRAEEADLSRSNESVIIFEQLCMNSSYPWRISLKFATRHPNTRSMRDNYSFVETFDGLWRKVWKWHLARTLKCVLEEEWFRIFDFYNEYLSKSDTRISTIFQKSGSERCLLMFNVSLRVSFAVKRRSRNRNLRDLCGNSHEPGCQRNIKDELKCSLEIREMYERLVWKIKSRP